MKNRHRAFEAMFFIGAILIIFSFFVPRLYPLGIVFGLVLMLLSAARERLHLLKHK
ncbi:hypothetical protein HYX15_04080 [Candidatus Woesearchaeota archaeon]|nr:hypothetical protein [Candidatus Woesearchaeota archaeon]